MQLQCRLAGSWHSGKASNPQYEPDDGPLTDSQRRQIRKLVGKVETSHVRSMLFRRVK